MKLGATGKFPKGRLGPDDEGELRFAVGYDAKSGNVIVDFGTPVHWLGLPPEMAMKLAEALLKHAKGHVT